MNKQCIICGAEFDARGCDKTCGRACSRKRISNRRREYRQRPEVQAAIRERMREYEREYRQRPEVQAAKREYLREYRQRPEVQAAIREYEREYLQRPEVQAAKREYLREYHREQAETASFWGALAMAGAVARIAGDDK